jgi:hypothetical protein
MKLLCHPTRKQFAEGYLAGSGEDAEIITDCICPPDKLYFLSPERLEEMLKPPCLHPLLDGRRCCECDTCQEVRGEPRSVSKVRD